MTQHKAKFTVDQFYSDKYKFYKSLMTKIEMIKISNDWSLLKNVHFNLYLV